MWPLRAREYSRCRWDWRDEEEKRKKKLEKYSEGKPSQNGGYRTCSAVWQEEGS